jgi:hypothetical protein
VLANFGRLGGRKKVVVPLMDDAYQYWEARLLSNACGRMHSESKFEQRLGYGGYSICLRCALCRAIRNALLTAIPDARWL